MPQSDFFSNFFRVKKFAAGFSARPFKLVAGVKFPGQPDGGKNGFPRLARQFNGEFTGVESWLRFRSQFNFAKPVARDGSFRADADKLIR